MLDLEALLSTTLARDLAGNPFTAGYLRLEQSGADTLVLLDYDGLDGSSYESTVVRLVNVAASSLTAFNFGGYAPGGGASTYTIAAVPPVTTIFTVPTAPTLSTEAGATT